MKYERFEDLPVWKLAIELATGIYQLTKDKFFNQPGDLKDQIRRASLSVSNNIAEGFERGSTAELLAFLYIARGSCGETRSMLLFTERFSEAEHLKSQISDIKLKAESCSRQIRGWADNLQNSDIKGQRHLNENTRGHYDQRKRAEAFDKKIKDMMRKARPQDYPEE
ncbi:MAG TPA: four helix bundle protein [Phycisphaerales bacterium]|nr:four helix bundle protein [Phycisphaerales bacterium]